MALANFIIDYRICPGRHLAEANFWLIAASILAVFEIRSPLNANGCEAIPDIQFTSAVTR
jgi:hypothetical protein